MVVFYIPVPGGPQGQLLRAHSWRCLGASGPGLSYAEHACQLSELSVCLYWSSCCSRPCCRPSTQSTSQCPLWDGLEGNYSWVLKPRVYRCGSPRTYSSLSFVTILFLFVSFYFWPHPVVPRSYSWLCSKKLLSAVPGEPYGVPEIEPGLLHAEQTPYLLYYHSNPVSFVTTLMRILLREKTRWHFPHLTLELGQTALAVLHLEEHCITEHWPAGP